MEKLNSNKWAYLSGLFDGEGTFCISKSTNPNGVSVLSAYAKVANTNLELMQWLIKNFGGQYHTSSCHRDKRNPNCKIQYSWSPKGKKNRTTTIENLIPYLVIKKEQAKVLLQFDSVYGRNGCRPGIKLTSDMPEYIENNKIREELRLKLVALNHKR